MMSNGIDSAIKTIYTDYTTKDGKKVHEQKTEIIPSKSGAATGMAIGTIVAGPVGAIVGGAIGGIFGPED